MKIITSLNSTFKERDLLICLNSIGIKSSTIRHPKFNTVNVSQKIRKALRTLPHGHCKNLFLRDKKRNFFFFVTLENKRINLNRLQEILNSMLLCFGRPRDMLGYLGVKHGSVTPFSAINPSQKMDNLHYILEYFKNISKFSYPMQ